MLFDCLHRLLDVADLARQNERQEREDEPDASDGHLKDDLLVVEHEEGRAHERDQHDHRAHVHDCGGVRRYVDPAGALEAHVGEGQAVCRDHVRLRRRRSDDNVEDACREADDSKNERRNARHLEVSALCCHFASPNQSAVPGESQSRAGSFSLPSGGTGGLLIANGYSVPAFELEYSQLVHRLSNN